MRRILFLAVFLYGLATVLPAWADDSAEYGGTECVTTDGDYWCVEGDATDEGATISCAGSCEACLEAEAGASSDVATMVCNGECTDADSCGQAYFNDHGDTSPPDVSASDHFSYDPPAPAEPPSGADIAPVIDNASQNAAHEAAPNGFPDTLTRTEEAIQTGINHLDPNQYSGPTDTAADDHSRIGADPHSTFDQNPLSAALDNTGGKGTTHEGPGPAIQPPSPMEGRHQEPIQFFTGEFVTERCDVTVPSRGIPLQWCRTYRSRLKYAGPLGVAWTHNYNRFLTVSADGQNVLRMGPNGLLQNFSRNAGGFGAPTGFPADLTQPSPTTFVLTFFNGTKETYGPDQNAGGQWMLTRIQDYLGNEIRLAYEASRLTGISDPLGFNLKISYDNAKGTIQNIRAVAPDGLATGQTVSYTYEDIDTSDVTTRWTLGTATVTPTEDLPSGSTETYGYDSGHYSTEESAPTQQEVTDFCSQTCGDLIQSGCSDSCATGNDACSHDCESQCEADCPDNCDESCGDCAEPCQEYGSECGHIRDECLTEGETECDSVDWPDVCGQAVVDRCSDDCGGVDDSDVQDACETHCVLETDASSCPDDSLVECKSLAESTCSDLPEESDCTSDCEDDCENDCNSECESDCPSDCPDACFGNEGDCIDYANRCEPWCHDMASQTEDRTHQCGNDCFNRLFVYGIPSDLNFNLVSIHNNEGTIFIHNEYGNNPHDLSFDRVIRQQWGTPEQILGFRYEGDDRTPTIHVTDRNGVGATYVFNQEGNVTEKHIAGHPSVAEGEELVTHYSYTTTGAMQSITYPNYNRLFFSYDDKNRDPHARGNIHSVTAESSPDGSGHTTTQVTTWTYDPRFNRVATITTPRGNTILTNYDHHGNTDKVAYPSITLPNHHRKQINALYFYNSKNQLIEVVDPRGVVTKYLYNSVASSTQGLPCGTLGADAGGLLRAIIHDADSPRRRFTDDTAKNAWECFDYNPPGQLTDYTDTEGRKWTLQNNARGFPKVVSGPMGMQIRYQYDADDHIVHAWRSMLDTHSVLGTEQEFIFHYNLLESLQAWDVEVSEGVFHTTVFGYDKNGNLNQIDDPVFGKQHINFNNLDLPFTERRGDGELAATRSYLYDLNGNLMQYQDAEGNGTYYDYDGFDRLSRKQFDDESNIYTYDDDSNLTNVERFFLHSTRRHEVSTFDYDEMGWLRTVQQKADQNGNVALTEYFRSAIGAAEQIIDPNTLTTHVTFDGLNRVKRVQDEIGRGAEMTFDSSNHLYSLRRFGKDEVANAEVSFTDIYKYDPLGRLSDSFATDGTQTHQDWDGTDQLIKVDHPNGTVEQWKYDGLQRPLNWSLTAPGSTQKMVWDWNDLTKTVTLTDSIHGQTTTQFDPLFRVKRVKLPNGELETFKYNKEDHIIGWKDPEENKITQTVSPRGDVLLRHVTRGPRTVGTTEQEFRYAGGRLIWAFDNNDPTTKEDDVTIELDYDPLGNLILDRINGRDNRARRELGGEITELTYPTGRSVVHDRDLAGRLKGITVGGIPIFAYDYFAFEPGRVRFPKTQETIGYDTLGRVHEIESQLTTPATRLAWFRYGLDAANIPQSIEAENGIKFQIANSHDTLGQLHESNITAVGAHLPDSWLGKYSYAYDSNGNRKSFEYTGAHHKLSNYLTDTMSQYKDISTPRRRDAIHFHPEYDKKGNVLKGSKDFQYDFLGRLRDAHAEQIVIDNPGISRQTPPLPFIDTGPALTPNTQLPGTSPGSNPLPHPSNPGVAPPQQPHSDATPLFIDHLLVGTAYAQPRLKPVMPPRALVGYEVLGFAKEDIIQREGNHLFVKMPVTNPQVVKTPGHATPWISLEVECKFLCIEKETGLEFEIPQSTPPAKQLELFKKELQGFEKPLPVMTFPATGLVIVVDGKRASQPPFRKIPVAILKLGTDAQWHVNPNPVSVNLQQSFSAILTSLGTAGTEGTFSPFTKKFTELSIDEKMSALQWQLEFEKEKNLKVPAIAGIAETDGMASPTPPPAPPRLIELDHGPQGVSGAENSTGSQSSSTTTRHMVFIYDATDRLVGESSEGYGKKLLHRWGYFGLMRTVEYRDVIPLAGPAAPISTALEFYNGAGGVQYIIPIQDLSHASQSDPRSGWALHSDHLGSTMLVTDESNGSVLERYYYDPFGNHLVENGDSYWQGSKIGNPILFAGQYFDAASELYLLHFRTYDPDPQWGRFLQRDPAGFPDGPNPYVYALNSPYALIDPLGLDSKGHQPDRAGETPSLNGWWRYTVEEELPDYFGGFAYGYANDQTGGLAPSAFGWERIASEPAQRGETMAHVVSAGQAVVEMVTGAAGIAGGAGLTGGGLVLAPATGGISTAAVPFGVAAIAEGTALAGHGVVSGGRAIASLTNQPMQRGGKATAEQAKLGGKQLPPATKGQKIGDYIVRNRMEDPRILKLADKGVVSKGLKEDARNLINQYVNGNKNPGRGTRPVFPGVSELRSYEATRVYFREYTEGSERVFEIVGASGKEGTQDQVIVILKKIYDH